MYQARQLSTGQSVAIKLLALTREGAGESIGREVERFRRETRICAALSHMHIVQLIDSGETPDGELYAVFAYVPGETLEQALSREGALGVREAVRLMTQVLEALAMRPREGRHPPGSQALQPDAEWQRLRGATPWCSTSVWAGSPRAGVCRSGRR